MDYDQLIAFARAKCKDAEWRSRNLKGEFNGIKAKAELRLWESRLREYIEARDRCKIKRDT